MKTLIWLLFLPGFLCSENTLKINPDSLVTWRGSCVLIPCQISTYKGAALRDISLLWYFQPFYDTDQSEYSGYLLYNSSSTPRNYKTRSQTASASRFEFVGNVEKKTCSLKISRVRTEDSGIYGARLTASYSRPFQYNKWFLNATVNVAESPPAPKIDINPKDVQEGWTTVTCSVPYHCPEEPLRLTISGLENSRFSSQPPTITNGVIQTIMGFQGTWKDHGKSLVCSLKRDWKEISQNTMKLDVKYAPKDVQVRASPGTIVREGETLSLECMINSSNPEVSEYLWYQDDQPMYEQPRLKKIEFETRGDRHSGAYRCVAKNSVGSQKSEELSIDVQYPPKETKVNGWTGGAIEEGKRMDLQCSSNGNPPVTHYEWYKEPQTAIFRISKRLRFDAIQLGNAGTYYCVANNSLGHLKSSSITLDVHYGPKDVRLAIENAQLPIKENDTITLNCSFSHSNPSNSIRYKWYKNKLSLPEQRNPRIMHAVLERAGDYTCDACNDVKCGSSQPVTVDIHYAPKEVKVLQEPKNPIHEGKQVNLRCYVTKANPKTDSYRWYKDGVQQHPDSAADHLTIDPVTSAHSGRYWCEATNIVATSHSQQIILNVYYGPRNVRLSLERQVAVIEGMDVSLLCAADANPSPHAFELYRDEEKLMARNDRILLLRKVQVEDSGDYHCKAYNSLSAGESQTLMLSVSYSRATKLKHGMKGLGIILSVIFILGMLIFALKTWKKKRGPGASRTTRSGSFFVRKVKYHVTLTSCTAWRGSGCAGLQITEHAVAPQLASSGLDNSQRFPTIAQGGRSLGRGTKLSEDVMSF
ncbi:B-cell receptor CD22-like [Heteronotia binoei]|uniref:B-cell receptor CD22-like n=1 Tax=Heteronotia binoei TaxID=13085 RepID=UPI0029314316|nr:B-cell receptor CD22-like [Heteronotia binoei]